MTILLRVGSRCRVRKRVAACEACSSASQVDGSPNPVTLRPLELQDADMIAGWAADPSSRHEADWTDDLPFTERQRFHQTLLQSPPPELIRLGAIH